MTRPAHEPLALRCPVCAAPLRVADERAQLVVCGSCDSHLELSGPLRDTLDVLSGKSARKVGYALDLGQDARWRGARYEVVARTCWTEEGSMAYATRTYVLYHPRRPLLYLSEYDDAWDVSWKVHVMPRQPPRSLRAGSGLQTHDGKKWTVAEVVQRTLVHVDGCLPWVAEVGRTVTAWECTGSGDVTYEIEAQEGEIEYHRGRQLSRAEVRRLLPGADVAVARPQLAPALAMRQAQMMLVAGIVGAVMHGVLAGWASSAGDLVFAEGFSADQLTGEVTSSPFELSGDGLVRLRLTSADLDNAWMSVNVALVQDDDIVVHVTDSDLSYYHGVEGGESWSEGSRDADILLGGVQPGPYRLHLGAVSNTGESESANRAQHSLRASVRDRAHPATPALFGFALCVGLSLLGFAWAKKLKEDE